MPASEVAIGFAGKSVSQIQDALTAFNNRVQKDNFSQSDEPLWKYNNRIMRVLRDEVSNIKSKTSLILGILHNTRPDANLFKLIWVENKNIVQESDIPSGEFKASGSAFQEGFGDVLKETLGQAFIEPSNLPSEYSPFDIERHAELLSTQYSLVWEQMREARSSGQKESEGLKTAGPVLHTVISKGGHFQAFTNTFETVFEGKRNARIKTRYNQDERSFELVNCDTGETKELYSIDKYIFSKSDTGDDLFDVSLKPGI